MNRLTPEQQVDVLWKALGDSRYWLSLDHARQLVLLDNEDSPSRGHYVVGAVQHVFSGSRQSCIEQLHARQVADLLDGYKEPDPKVSDDFFDAGPNSYF